MKSSYPAPKRPTKETLHELYITGGLSARQIAKRLDVSPTSVKNWLRLYDIPRRPDKPSLEHRGVKPPTAEDLYRMVHMEHLGHREIAERLNISSGSIVQWLRFYDIPRPTAWETRRGGRIPDLPDRDTLHRLYFDEGLSQVSIAGRYGVSGTIIAGLFREYGLTARPAGFNGGERFTCADGHIVRSTYEQRVDNWLFEQGIPHVYEPPLPFDRRMKSDFLANGWYIEVWGVTGQARYRERKRIKRKLYVERGLPLIQIGADAFAPCRDTWRKHLARCKRPAHAIPQQTLDL